MTNLSTSVATWGFWVTWSGVAHAADAPLAWSDDPANAEKLDRLYEEAFGRDAGSAIEVLPIPASVNGQASTEVLARVRFGDPESFEVSCRMLVQALKPSLSQGALDALDDLSRGRDWIRPQDLAQLGISGEFDEARLELSLTVPADLMPTQVRDLSGLPAEADDALGPAQVSGFLTARARATWAWQEGDGQQNPPEALVDLESAVQLKGVVAEAGAIVDSQTSGPVTRSYSRVVYDDQERAIRYTVGDFVAPYAGFHDSLALRGVSAARNFALQPYVSYRPAGRFEFLLESRSRVNIYLNDVLVDSLDLEAGAHDIRNFPLCHGANDIKVVIIDSSGSTREVDFSTAVSADLLARGAHQFSYGAGFMNEGYAPTYDWSRPTLSLVHRTGLTDTLTVQAYSAVNPSDQLVGAGQALATTYGNVSLDLGAGHTTNAGFMAGTRLRYELLKVQGTSAVTRGLAIELEYRPVDLGRLGDVIETEPMTTSLSLSQVLPGNSRATFDARHQFGGHATWQEPDIWAQLGLQSSFWKRLSATAYGAHERSYGSPVEWKVGISLMSSFQASHQSLRGAVEHSTVDGPSEVLSWSHATPRIGTGTQSGVTLADAGGLQSFFAHSELATSRGTLGIAHSFSGDGLRVDPGSQTSELTAAAALAFADGIWGLSAPIDGSFVIVGRQERMKGQVLQLNPSQQKAAARADRFGPAVLPNLAAYRLSQLTLDAPDLPLGIELGPSRFHILPGYKTGTALRIGNKASILVQGVLARPDGTPASFITGQVVNRSDPDAPPSMLFTNGSGRFYVEGLVPGRYEIVSLPTEGAPVEFSLSMEIEGLHSLGTLVVPEVPRSATMTLLSANTSSVDSRPLEASLPTAPHETRPARPPSRAATASIGPPADGLLPNEGVAPGRELMGQGDERGSAVAGVFPSRRGPVRPETGCRGTGMARRILAALLLLGMWMKLRRARG